MKKCFELAMDIGEQMLMSGAEVSRVEEALGRMSAAFGADRSDIFIITSSMLYTAFCGDEVYTESRRINVNGNDIERLHRLNSLCRSICEGLSLEEAEAEFRAIMAKKRYPLWVEVGAFGLITACFCLFFGGGIPEAAVALALGLVLRFIALGADRLTSNKIFSKFICSLAATAMAYLGQGLGLIPTVDNVIIGCIMVLIPGVGFTSALRDLFIGDSMTGTLRLIESVLAALAIAAGYFVFVMIGGSLI